MAARMAQFTAGDTLLHRLNALSKLLVVVLVCVAALLFRQWIVPAALAAALMLLYAGRFIGFARLLPVLKPLPLFIAVIVLANIFLVHREAAWRVNAEAGLVQGLRIVVIIVAASLFVAVTDPIDLSDAVLRFLKPLERVGLRVGELSLMTMIAFSFIPFMTEEARRLQLAQAVRCGFPKRGFGVVRTAPPLLAALVVGLFRRSDEIDLALRARCYRIGAPRSRFESGGWRPADSLVCVASILLFLGGLYAQF
jgi:energy-coupling factor transport system permease protein